MKMYRLSEAQLRGLKEHKYLSEGSSLFEVFMQPYWRWLVTKVPLWIAPNLLTAIGLLMNVLTSLPVLILDSNMEGVAPQWSYVVCAVGFFIYQSLDAIDGKQARRTNSANQLGELFDHGCDALSIFLVLTTGASAAAFHEFPLSFLSFVVLLGQLNYFYHWQTYVCGVLHFKLIDVTEAQFLHMALLMINGIWGVGLLKNEFFGLGVSLKAVLVVCVLGISFLNLLHAMSIVFTLGVGKNGTTVANTSIISPVLSTLLLVPVPFLYYSLSPSPLLLHSLLFVSAMCLPTIKTVFNMIISAMTKSPYPLFEPVVFVPWLAFLNIYIGNLLPEYAVLLGVVVCSLVDILLTCLLVCRQVASYLQVPIFSLPKS